MGRLLFIENAYSILGLDSSASDREILKRSKEIENLLKIDESPEYDLDLSFSSEYRTEANVRTATQELTTTEQKLFATFFWFYLKDSTDEKAFKLCQEDDWTGAIELWDGKLSSKPNDFISLKNKAVCESILFYQKAQKKYLNSSIKEWKSVIQTDKNRAIFKKLYLLDNPNTGDNQFKVFFQQLDKTLASFYEFMSKKYKDPELFAAFSKHFDARSDQFDNEVLEPLLNDLNSISKKLSKYEIEWFVDGDKKGVSDESVDILKKFCKESDKITDKIQALGEKIWNSSKVIVVRDENAAALRGQALAVVGGSRLDTYPEDLDLTKQLIKTAYNISGSSMLETKLEKDQNDLKRLKHEIALAPKIERIVELMKMKRFSDALNNVKYCLENEDLTEEEAQDFRQMKAKLEKAVDRQTWDTIKAVLGVIALIIFGIIWLVSATSKSSNSSSSTKKTTNYSNSTYKSK